MMLRADKNGQEHGLVTTLINQVSKAEAYKKLDAKRKEELESRIKRNSVLKKVRYIHFKNQETGHRCADYTAGAGEPLYVFKFLHDNVYTVPLGLIELINGERSARPVREGSLDSNGVPLAKDAAPIRLDGFVSDLIM